MSSNNLYVLAIYIITRCREPPVQTQTVARKLDRSKDTVSEMFQQLEDAGLVTYEPYEGVTLTESGRTRGETLYERYVVVSLFYQSVLDLDSHDRAAMEAAASLSESVTDRLAAVLPFETDSVSEFQGWSPDVPDDEVVEK